VIDLIGKLVTVETAETFYEGKLVEVGEDEVHLESDMGWIVIPVQKITSVREKD
jgi:ribosome maturation factor RimP